MAGLVDAIASVLFARSRRLARAKAETHAIRRAKLVSILDRAQQAEGNIALLKSLIIQPPQIHVPAPGALFPSPAVSVITPTFNRARFVTEAIASVVAQSFADWELLVVDDGSTDGTEAAVAPFLTDSRIRYFRQENGGPSAARNRAVREARGTLLAFLDSDNLYFPGFLAFAVEAFHADPALSVGYGALVRPEDGGEPAKVSWRPFDRTALLDRNYIDMNALVCRKAEVERIGGFDEGIFGTEDWDLVLRLTEHAPAVPLPVLAAYYRTVDRIRLTDTLTQDQRFGYIREKHGPSPVEAASGGPPGPQV